MAAAFRSSSNTTYASRTNTTVTAPTGIADGDVLLYFIFAGRATSSGGRFTVTAPTGFSAPSGGTWPIALQDSINTFQVNVYVWYKIASGESGDYTATHISGSTQGSMIAVSGGSSSAPVSTTNSGTGSTTTALTITTSANDSLIVFAGWDWGDTANNLTAPSGTTPTFTERIDVAPLHYLATGGWASSGATGNKTQTNNSTGSNPWAGVLVAVEASGATPSLVHRNLLLGVGT